MYITYTCSVCRRFKDIELDSKRAVPNLCTITKGCGGRLLATGESSVQIPTPSVVGLEDWYARGQRVSSAPAELTSDDSSIATSEFGALTLAVKLDPLAEDLPEEIAMTLLQRKEGAIPFNQHTFRLTTSSTEVSGKDANGKIMRFNTQAINQGRVYVRVNGVSDETITLTTDTVSFGQALPAGTLIDVIVYTAPIYEETTITFKRNNLSLLSVARGSWMNVHSLEIFEDGAWESYVLYSVDFVNISPGKMKFMGLNYSGLTPFFCLASSPYEAQDRYYNFVVRCEEIQNFEMYLARGRNHMMISDHLISEIYPSIKISGSDLIEPDLKTTSASSLIQLDESNARRISSKIIGPL